MPVTVSLYQVWTALIGYGFERHGPVGVDTRLYSDTPIACSGVQRIETTEGDTIALASHLETKTGVLVETLRAAGAHVLVTGSEPFSTKEAVVEALREIEGIETFIE